MNYANEIKVGDYVIIEEVYKYDDYREYNEYFKGFKAKIAALGDNRKDSMWIRAKFIIPHHAAKAEFKRRVSFIFIAKVSLIDDVEVPEGLNCLVRR